ncbi:hypothetical protein P692DRAFT_201899470, partial [Suillus brevipes Sb2]
LVSQERAGHHLKLYQYCSGDIHDIIQCHVRYDGEKDTRTPHDLVNNANAKLNHDADVDDDEGDDDDDPDSAPTRGSKRRHEPKLKAEYSNGVAAQAEFPRRLSLLIVSIKTSIEHQEGRRSSPSYPVRENQAHRSNMPRQCRVRT